MKQIKAEDYKEEIATIFSLSYQIQTIECKIKHQKTRIIEDILNRLGLDKEVYLKENNEKYVKGGLRVNKENNEIEFFKNTDIENESFVYPYYHFRVFIGNSLQADLDNIVKLLQYRFTSAEKLKEKTNDE